MRDSLSLIITVIVIVILMVIFPLYNNFERQDDMSYNLVLRSVTNFVDQVLNTGYIDQEMYDNFINNISTTGNLYDIELEAHRKLLIKDPDNAQGKEYIEEYEIDYNDDIFYAIENDITSITSLSQRTLKSKAYLFNEGDQFYIKVKNSNITMAGAIFDAIVPTSKKDRISVNYGGVIKNTAWKEVNSTYLVYSSSGKDLLLNSTSHPSIKDNPDVSALNANITFKAVAQVESWWSNPIYVWEIRYSDDSTRIISDIANTDYNAVNNGILTVNFKNHKGNNIVTVYAKSKEGQVTSSQMLVINVQ